MGTGILFGTILLILSGISVAQNEGKKISEQCVSLIIEISNCSQMNNIPARCVPVKASDVTKCSNNAMKHITDCKDDSTATKFITQFNTNVHNSDMVMCHGTIGEELNARCKNVAAYILNQMTLVNKDFITTEGCKYSKTMSYVTVNMYEKHGCNSSLKQYVDDMYSTTVCADVQIDTSAEDDNNDNRYVIQYMLGCWINNSGLPDCNGESEVVKCVEDFDFDQIKNPIFKDYADRFIEVTKASDKVLCQDKGLLKALQDHSYCLVELQNAELFVVEHGKGLYTKEGCSAEYFDEIFLQGRWTSETCRPYVDKYREAVLKEAPCYV